MTPARPLPPPPSSSAASPTPALERFPSDPSVEVEEDRGSPARNTEPHDQPARVSTDACEIALRALDLMFPQEDSDDDLIPPEDSSPDGQVTDEDEETNCPGKFYPVDEAEKWGLRWLKSYSKRLGDHSRLCDDILARGDKNARLPPCPVKVLPEVTSLCVSRSYCYHREYMTHDSSTTESTLRYCTPRPMLQIFFLRLSSSKFSYPITVYGIFAVRDYLDPQRNHVFNRARDNPITIEQEESLTLPLCSPCRGMYIRDRALVEVDLWVKIDGERSADKHLLSEYAEIDVMVSYDLMQVGRIANEDSNLDMGFMILTECVQAAIQVYAKVDHSHHVRFTAFSSGFDQEIVLFDDRLLVGKEKIFQHVVAVKSNKMLDVLLKLEKSLFRWTFEDGYDGAVCSPDDSIFEYGQFYVRVLFASEDF